MYLLPIGLIKYLVGAPVVNDTYQRQNNRNVIVIAETGFSHGTQNSSNSESTVNREQGEQNNSDRKESDTREEQIPSFDQSKHKDITSSSKLGVQDNKSSHGTKIEEDDDCYNRLNSNKRYDSSQNQIDTIKSLIENEVQQNDKTSIQIEVQHNSNNCSEHSKNNSRTFRDSNKQSINEKEIKEEEKIGTKCVRFDLSMQNTYRFQRNEKNETVDLLANQSNRRFVEDVVEAKLDSSSESNNDSKERNQRLNASGQNRGHQNYIRFQRGGRYCNNFQNDRRNDRQQFNNCQTGNWQGDQNNYSRGRWINNRGFSNNRQERSDHPDQYRKGNAQFIDNPSFNHNEESRPNSVQSNYEVRESENAIPERPGSSQSDYQRNNRTNNPNFHSTRRHHFQGHYKSYERVFSPNFNHNKESRPNSVQSNNEEGRSGQNFCLQVPNRSGLNQSNYQRNTHTNKPNYHDIRNNARIQDSQGQNNFDQRVLSPNFIHKNESRPNSVQSHYEEGRSEQNFSLQVPNIPGLNQSNYQRTTHTNKPNCHDIRNNARIQDSQGQNNLVEHVLSPNFIHKKESRPNSVQSNYEEGRSEQNFCLQIPNRPGLNHSNYQRNTRSNEPNFHDIRNNSKRQDFQVGNDFDERIHYICNSCSQYGNNRGFRGNQNRPYNQSTRSSTVHGSHVPNPDNSERQFHGRERGNGFGGTVKKLTRMRIAKETKTNIAQEINSVNECESKDESEDASDNESDETNAENADQPFQVSSLDFKDGFPMDEAEAARRNIDLNEEVEDIMLFGKDGDVVVTEQPKTLRDMMIFMQKYPNATAVTIKEKE